MDYSLKKVKELGEVLLCIKKFALHLSFVYQILHKYPQFYVCLTQLIFHLKLVQKPPPPLYACEHQQRKDPLGSSSLHELCTTIDRDRMSLQFCSRKKNPTAKADTKVSLSSNGVSMPGRPFGTLAPSPRPTDDSNNSSSHNNNNNTIATTVYNNSSYISTHTRARAVS